MMTAGMAATRPIAVASSASAMPGATTARFVVCDFEMPMKLFMMPHTVPKRPADIRASRSAAARNDGRMPSLAPSAICASASERASAILFSAERSLVAAIDNSIDLAISTVQVISDAKASPIITDFTMMSADWNITQGDNSFMAGAMPAAVSDFAAAGGAATGAGLTADG